MSFRTSVAAIFHFWIFGRI